VTFTAKVAGSIKQQPTLRLMNLMTTDTVQSLSLVRVKPNLIHLKMRLVAGSTCCQLTNFSITPGDCDVRRGGIIGMIITMVTTGTSHHRMFMGGPFNRLSQFFMAIKAGFVIEIYFIRESCRR
jgi:hypothetical protein